MEKFNDLKKSDILELVERNTMKPPDVMQGNDTTGFRFKCPVCRHPLGHAGKGYGGYMDYEQFCPRCAQRIDWNARGIHPGWGKYTVMKMTGSVGYREKEED